jgi:hypothetical protein
VSNPHNNVINIWEAKYKNDGRKNLEEFVQYVKNELTLYNDQGWKTDKWKPNKGQTLVFGEQDNAYAPVEPWKNPFMDFAKAFIKQQMTIKETSSAHLWIATLRNLYNVLKEQYPDEQPCILNISNKTILAVEEKIRKNNCVAMRKYHLGAKLQAFVLWLRENKIILTLPEYKNPFKKPAHKAEQLGEEGDKWREERCPTMHEMLCLADCFAQAKENIDLYYTSVLVLLCFAPARVNELSGITIHSLQQDDDGGWYVVWYGSKGYPDHRKGVPDLLLDIVKEAFRRLEEISEPARKAAKWAYENPDKFYRHEQCTTKEGLGEDEPMSESEFAHAMHITGCLHHTNKEKINTPVKWINKFLEEGNPTYRRLNKLIHDKYENKDWPNNPKSERPIWENLFLIRENETHQSFKPKLFSWVMPSVDTINNQISPRPNVKMSPLWERFGMVNEDGSPLSMTTHQLRVWLNTHAKIGGVDDWKISQWSGRADIKQNPAYDLRTAEERNLIKTQLMVASYDSVPNPVALRKANLPVPLRSIGIDRDGVADFTGIGFCTHNFAQTPCTKAGECVTCKEHVCLTGIPETHTELQHLEKKIAAEFELSVKAAEDETFGADRWVTHLGWKLAHIRTLIEHKTDKSLPEGTIIRIPVEHDPSPTRRALVGKGMITDLEEDKVKKKQLTSNVHMKKLLGFG